MRRNEKLEQFHDEQLAKKELETKELEKNKQENHKEWEKRNTHNKERKKIRDQICQIKANEEMRRRKLNEEREEAERQRMLDALQKLKVGIFCREFFRESKEIQ